MADGREMPRATRPTPDPSRDRCPPSDFNRERRSGRAQQRRRRNSVLRYIDTLKQSASAVQTLQGLMTSNQELQDQVKDLQSQVEDLRQKNSRLEQDKAAAQQETAEQEKSIQAMDWFWQIDEAYVRGKYTLCRKLIQSLEDANLQDTLPKVSITDNDRFSPYDRYLEIRGRVVK